MIVNKALILAAGNGSRLGCKDLPKPMYDVGGMPVLERSLVKLSEAGFEKAIISVGFKKDKIIEYFGDRYRDINIEYVEGGETIGASIVNALIGVNEPIFCIYGDNVTDMDYGKFVESHNASGKLLTALGVRRENTKSFGLLRQDEETGEYRFISKYTRVGKHDPGIVDAGHYIINPEVFGIFQNEGLDSIDSLLLKMNNEGGFHVYIHEGKWIDLNFPEYYEEARKVFGVGE